MSPRKRDPQSPVLRSPAWTLSLLGEMILPVLITPVSRENERPGSCRLDDLLTAGCAPAPQAGLCVSCAPRTWTLPGVLGAPPADVWPMPFRTGHDPGLVLPEGTSSDQRPPNMGLSLLRAQGIGVGSAGQEEDTPGRAASRAVIANTAGGVSCRLSFSGFWGLGSPPAHCVLTPRCRGGAHSPGEPWTGQLRSEESVGSSSRCLPCGQRVPLAAHTGRSSCTGGPHPPQGGRTLQWVGQGPDDAHTYKNKGAHAGLDRKRYSRTRHTAPGGRAPGPGPTPCPRLPFPATALHSFTVCEPTGKLTESTSIKLN